MFLNVCANYLFGLFKQNNRIHADSKGDTHECFICCNSTDQEIDLSCGHKIHAACLKSWWLTNPQNGFACPYCRTRAYGCFMEINSRTKIPVSYFRHDSKDHALVIILNDSGRGKKNEFVKISEDDYARNLAQHAIAMRANMIYYNVAVPT